MLREKINQDLKKAQQEKNELIILVLRGINSEIHNREIEKTRQKRKAHLGGPATIPQEADLSGELTEEEIIEVVSNETKKRKESIEEFSAHGGSASGGKKEKIDNLIKKEKSELKILKEYLPEQMSEEQIREEAKKTIEETGATGQQDTGKVMSVLMPKLKGKAEGGLVNKVVNDLLRS